MRLQGSGRVTFGRWSRAVVLATAALTALVAAAHSRRAGRPAFRRLILSRSPLSARHPGIRAREPRCAGLRAQQEDSGGDLLRPGKGSRRGRTFFLGLSSPDALEVLKESGDLSPFRPNVPGVPETVGNYPINDPDGFYTGFAVSGYGMMWNTRYLERRGLAPAQILGRFGSRLPTTSISASPRPRARAPPTSSSRASCRTSDGTPVGPT